MKLFILLLVISSHVSALETIGQVAQPFMATINLVKPTIIVAELGKTAVKGSLIGKETLEDKLMETKSEGECFKVLGLSEDLSESEEDAMNDLCFDRAY